MLDSPEEEEELEIKLFAELFALEDYFDVRIYEDVAEEPIFTITLKENLNNEITLWSDDWHTLDRWIDKLTEAKNRLLQMRKDGID